MEEGEVSSDQTPLSDQSSFTNLFHGSTSVDTFFDDFLKNMQTCTHTHTCNDPGPDEVHTHTCYHTHTQVFTSEEDDKPKSKQNSALKIRRPSGNREAVRKYREKKKAQTAYLEEEVKKLRVLNQQLVKKLQGQALLEAEVFRLRSLLVDLRGKIDTKLGVIPFKKQSCSISFKEGDCRVQPNIGSGTDLQCEMGVQCLHPLPVASSLHLQTDIKGNTKMAVNREGADSCQANQDIVALGQSLATVEVNMDANRVLVSPASQTK